MRQIFFCVLMIMLSATYARAQQPDFNGSFSAVNPQNNSTLIMNLRNVKSRVTGKYFEPANPDAVYSISGVVKDGVLKGLMIDLVSGIWQFRFTATPEGDGFHFKLDNKFWASVIPEIVFKPSVNTETGAGGADAGFYPSLAGNWYNMDSYSSSNYSGSTYH